MADTIGCKLDLPCHGTLVLPSGRSMDQAAGVVKGDGQRTAAGPWPWRMNGCRFVAPGSRARLASGGMARPCGGDTLLC